MAETRRSLAGILADAVKDRTRLILLAVLIAASLLNILVYFQKIIGFLNTNLQTLWGLLFILLFLGFFLGYRFSYHHKGFKSYFYDYGEVVWLVRPSILHTVWVEEAPYCKRCKVQYLVLQNGGLACPQCQGTKEVLPLPDMRRAVESIAKAKARGLDKLTLSG